MSTLDDLKRAELLANGLDELAAAKRRAEELASKEWRESEVRELMDQFRSEGPDGIEKLLPLQQEVEKARREGRYVDDASPTSANLRNQLGPGAWVVPRALVAAISEYGRHLDRELRSDPPKQRPPGPRKPAPMSFERAANEFLSSVQRTGGLSSDLHLGLVYINGSGGQRVTPRWLDGTHVPMSQPGLGNAVQTAWVEKAPAEWQSVADAQASRWLVLTDTWREVFEGFRRNENEPPFSQQPGMEWEPMKSPSEFDLVGYLKNTRLAREFLVGESRRRIDARTAQDEERRRKEMSADYVATKIDYVAADWRRP